MAAVDFKLDLDSMCDWDFDLTLGLRVRFRVDVRPRYRVDVLAALLTVQQRFVSLQRSLGCFSAAESESGPAWA